jgi:predicted secreted protein
MILHGKDLIISANGTVIAGAKSCDVEVECDTIPTSSPTDGQWEHKIVGRKSWKVSTSHLVPFETEPSHIIKAVGTCHKDGTNSNLSYHIIDGMRYAGGTRGLSIFAYYWYTGTHSSQFIPSYHATFDTYGDISNCQAMINAMNSNIDNGDLVVITSWDAYAMTAALKQAISTKLGVPLDSMPEVNPGQRASFALAGIAGDRGIAFANLNEGSDVHAELLLDNSRIAIRRTPVKDMLTKPGTTLTLQIQTDGLTADRLSGTAICKTARVTASLSNLIQGSFRFEGTGPLE